MARQSFAVNETPPASKLNALANQAVATCSSSTRPANIDGSVISETDTGLLRVGNGTVWKSVPRGELGNSTVLATGTGGNIFGTEIAVNGSAVTFTAVAGEIYVYEGNFTLSCATAGHVFTVWLNKDAAHIDMQRDVYISGVNILKPVPFRMRFTATAGSHTMSVTVFRGIGSTSGGAIPDGGDVTVSHIGGSAT